MCAAIVHLIVFICKAGLQLDFTQECIIYFHTDAWRSSDGFDLKPAKPYPDTESDYFMSYWVIESIF